MTRRLSALSCSPMPERVLSALAALVLLVFLLQTYAKTARPGGNDLSSYLQASRALARGENPYLADTPFPYIYPLFLAFLLVPLTWLPGWLAVALWFLLQTAAAAFAVICLANGLWRHLHPDDRHGWVTPALLACLLLAAVFQNNLLNGQVNFLVLALCVLFHHGLRRGQILLPALFLGAAVAIKLVPLLFLVYLLLRRRFAVTSLALAFALLFAVLPVLLCGGRIIEFYGHHARFILQQTAGNLPGVPHHSAFSFHHFLGRLLPGLQEVRWGRFVSALPVLLSLAAFDLRRGRRGDAASLWSFALYLLAILLLAPMSEKHHLAFAIPPLVLLTLHAWRQTGSGRCRAATAAAAPFVFFALGHVFRSDFFIFLALLVAFAAIVWLNRHAVETAA